MPLIGFHFCKSKTGHSIHRIVNYNENKVKENVAECIGAINYPADPEDMSINMKLKCFLKQLELNQNVKRNSVHISLNFHAPESQFQPEKLLAIAENYIEKIGFGKQPYLDINTMTRRIHISILCL